MRRAHRWISCLSVWAALASASSAGEPASLDAACSETKSSSNQTDWPQFRGPNRDDISTATGLLQTWPAEGPKLVWTARALGRGYSGPAIVDGKIFLGGTDVDQKNETIVCLNLADGSPVWSAPVGKFYDNGWGGGPRSTPTVDDGRVYLLSGVGTLGCFNAETGEKIWSKQLVDDFGGKVPTWGYSESVLVDDGKVICTPGGENTMVALDKKTGETIWTSTGVNEGAQYAAPIRAEVSGVPFYMTLTKGGVIAVSVDKGEFLWRFDKPGNKTASIPTPIFFNGDHVYATSGYSTGCGVVKLTAADGKITAEELYFNKEMVNHHGGVVLIDGKIYGHSDSKGWVCQDPLTGEVVWRERGALPKGSVTYADGRLYCFSEKDGVCALIGATTAGWEEHGRVKIPEETQLERGKGLIWTHPTIAQGKLFLRDQDLLFCFDVKAAE